MDKYTAKSKAPEDIHATALKQYRYAVEANRENTEAAYEDLRFASGEQWPDNAETLRKNGDRPILTVNMVPKFTRQVTGDIRQLRPAIRVIGIDDYGDQDTAEAFQGVIRYIERRSDAPYAYFRAVDSVVTCGVGAWRIETEESDLVEGVQEIRISPIRDCPAVVIDPDSEHSVRLDARFAFIPVDFTFDAFREKWPDSVAASFDDLDTWARSAFNGETSSITWYTTNTIRVLEYFCKKPDGKVYRYLMTGSEILEGPDEVPCRYIPIVVITGEEIVIGKKTIRRGLVRGMKDAQRLYNYMLSAQAEIVALQPKTPYVGTEKNFEKYEDAWLRAHKDNIPFLPFEPDPLNGGAAPQRTQPPVAANGIEVLAQRAVEGLKDVTGIYDASLGQRSNEQSGKAILARQREGDTGTFHFVEAFTRGLRLTGMILVDMIPRIYDTARVLRIIGDDGQPNEVKINQPVIMPDGRQGMNDVTVGKYDVTVESGPSYTTRRDEAREGMTAMMQAAPQIVPLIADLYATAQDWPEKEKIAKRLQAMLPPQIKAAEEQEAGMRNGMGPQQQMPQAPPPEVMQAMELQARQQEAGAAQAQMELQSKQMDMQKRALDVRKAEIDVEATARQRLLDLKASEARLIVEIAKAQAAIVPGALEAALQQVQALVQEGEAMMMPPAPMMQQPEFMPVDPGLEQFANAGPQVAGMDASNGPAGPFQ